RERDALFSAFDSKRPGESEPATATMRGAAMLHTARAFAALARGNDGEFRFQLLFADAFIPKLASHDRHDEFVRTWPLLVLALLQEGRMVNAASEFGRR